MRELLPLEDAVDHRAKIVDNFQELDTKITGVNSTIQGLLNRIVALETEVQALEAASGKVIVPNWQANTAYAMHQMVSTTLGVYVCIAPHTSTTVFDTSKWSEFSMV